MEPFPLPQHKRGFRALWVSDVHLGTRGAKAKALREFLQQNKPDDLYLCGDVVDGWALKRNWYWDEEHNALLRRILQMAAEGCRVHLVCGNHDEFLRSWIGLDLAGIRIVDEIEHETADGRRLLVLHGDQFDEVVRASPWLAHLGDWAYRALLILNAGVAAVRRRLGRPPWSLSLFLKQKVKAAFYRNSFERAAARAARERGCHGVICGHVHKAEIREVDGVLYCNSGDWVESLTALAEHPDGRIELLRMNAAAAPAQPRARAHGAGAASRLTEAAA